MGTAVTVLVRDRSRLEEALGPAADHVRLVVGDLNDAAALASAVEGAEIVFHAAARVHSLPRSHEEEQEFWEVNVAGTEALLAASARVASLKSFIFFSTVAVYGPAAGPLTESTPCAPETAYGRSKLKAENKVLAFGSSNGAHGVVLRLSMVYGEGDRGNLQRMIAAIERGKYVHIGGGRARKSATYVANVVDAAVLAASAAPAQGQVLLVSDPQPYCLREIANTIAHELGTSAPYVSLPVWIMMLAGRSFGLVQRLTGIRAPFTAREVRTLTTDVVCDTAKLQTLGFTARVRLEEGIARTVRSYKRQRTSKTSAASA
jgi:nucleoside-diphosphate-sugar epimerase